MKRSTYYPPETVQGNLWRGVRWGLAVSLPLWAVAFGALVAAVVIL